MAQAPAQAPQLGEQPDIPELQRNLTEISTQVGRFSNIPALAGADRIIRELKAAMDSMKADLTKDIESLKADLKKDIASVKAELTTDIESVKTDLKKEIESVKTELKDIASKKELTDLAKQMQDMRRDIVTSMQALDWNSTARLINHQNVRTSTSQIAKLVNVTTGLNIPNFPRTLRTIEGLSGTFHLFPPPSRSS